MLRVLSASLCVSLLVACASTTTTLPDGRAAPTAARVAELESQRAAASAFADTLADPALRARAVRALGRLERLDAVDPIVDALDDNDVAVRLEAAFAAGQLDLAIERTEPAHEAIAGRVEAALVARLDVETDVSARTAVVRALGRIARGPGRAALASLGSTTNPQQAAALQALAVSWHRRPAGPTDLVDEASSNAARAGLRSSTPEVATAAAYLTLRLARGTTAVDVAAAKSTQARLHLVRALAAKNTAIVDVNTALPALVGDADWRVVVEAVRVPRQHNDAAFEPVTRALARAVTAVAEPGMAHVIGEACTTLALVAPPSTLPAVLAADDALVAANAPGALWARCTCAGTAAVLGAGGERLAACSAGLSATERSLLAIQTTSQARTSSRERTDVIRRSFSDTSAKVRIAAASALCSDGSETAVDAAATQLLTEGDAGVVSALLECFADGANADIIKDRTIAVVVARLQGGTTFEALEPVITLAGLARGRPGSSALVNDLAEHTDIRVREAALGVRSGDRAPGARARAVLPTSSATLPLGLVLVTARGKIVVALDREHAPRAVATFVQLANDGVLNGTPFHRVIADFVSQGGDPRGDGSGGPGFTVVDEPADLPFVRGTVGVAHAGKDTGSSQFFLTHSDQPHLEGRYTRLGTIVEGLEVMDALQPHNVLLDVEVATALRP
jgi:cyclophilin family peptidyl-prolyl cis-trans isomerase